MNNVKTSNSIGTGFYRHTSGTMPGSKGTLVVCDASGTPSAPGSCDITGHSNPHPRYGSCVNWRSAPESC